MGQAILYCSICSTQLREAQFEQGKAYRIDNWVCCATCAPEAVKSLPPDRMKILLSLLAAPKRKSSSGIERVAPSRPSLPTASSTQMKLPRPAPPRNPWILVGIVGAALIVIAAVLLLRGGRPAEPESTTTTPATVEKKAAPPSPAQFALQDAQRFAREHPDDLQGQIRLFGDLGLVADKGPAGAEAKKTLETLRVREQEMAGRLMTALEAELAEPLRREEFGAALGTIDSARSRMPGARWSFLLEKRDAEIRAELRRRFDAMKAQAVEAKRKGERPALQALGARVKSWGLASYSSEWDVALAAVPEPPAPPPPPPPVRSVEAAAYQARWEEAMARASLRDFAGAIAGLQKAAEAVKEKPVQEEAAQDLKDLQETQRAWQSAVAALATERSLSLTTTDNRNASGRVLYADAERVEIFSEPRKPTVFVEWSDVSVVSLRIPEPRPAAILRALEGEPSDGLPAKYAALKAAKPAPEELQARGLYYEAERDFRSMATREKSIEAYKTLKTKFKDTMLVRGAVARIDRRLDAGREYFFQAADLAPSGTFTLNREGKLESIADSEPTQANRNGAEWEFLALPSQTYRCWALVGGCCADAFAFHYQATGLTETNPKTKKKAPAEPGGDLASPVKHSIRNLKPHPKNEPKKPTRWEWVEIAIPKLPTAGPRKVRLLTDQQGFAIAAVVVSATRVKPPTDAEAAELAKLRALDAIPPWAIDRPGFAARILLEDFEKEPSGWMYIGGQEFPGAQGSLALDLTNAHDGKGSYKLAADFTGGGGYVGTWRDLPGRNFSELRIWMKAPNVRMIMARLVDSSGQCHQRHILIAQTPDWQEVVVKFNDKDQDRWGGPADGVWRGPPKGYAINLTSNSFISGAPKGELWIDDIEGVLAEE